MGEERSGAFAINDLDQIVGVANTGLGANRFFLWQNGQMTDLSPFALPSQTQGCINNLGQIAGSVGELFDEHPAIYDSKTVSITVLTTLTGRAIGINASGQVTGYISPESGMSPYAFLYDQGVIVKIDSLGGDLAINESGQIVGHTVVDDVQVACVYTNGVIEYFGPQKNGSHARAINNLGQIVGYYQDDVGLPISLGFRAFSYSNGIFTDIGFKGSWVTVAHSINDSGQVVGGTNLARHNHCRTDCIPRDQSHAFLYENGLTTMLDTYFPPNSASVAYAINNKGHIVGQGVLNGQDHAFLLTRD